MFDKDMQKLYVFTKYLAKLLPKNNEEKVNLDDELLLEYYKLQKTSEGAITLNQEEGLVVPVQGAGASAKEKEKGTLSEIIDKFNKKFGTEFSKLDKVMSDFKEDIMKDEQISNAGKKGDKTAFNTLYEKKFTDIAMNRYDESMKESKETDDFFKGLFENIDKFKFFKELLLTEIYNELRNKQDE